MADNTKPKVQRSTTSSKNRQNSPPPYRSHAETSMEDFVNEFWQHAMNVAEHHEDDFKHQALPLARIKKVAKMDPEVQNQMISSEVTVLFEKACQIFIQELTARAHLVSLAARRRTLSRADVAQAVSRSDMFDFLIDIVPRTEQRAAASTSTGGGSGSAAASGSGSKRPSRSRKHSQRNSPAPEYPVAAAEGDEDDDDDDEPSGKRFRLAEGQEQPHPLQPPPMQAFAQMDPAQAQAHAAAAAAAGFFLPQTMPDGTAFAPGQMPWGPPFDYSAAPPDPSLQAFYRPQSAGAGTHASGNGAGPSGSNGAEQAQGE
ncbi:Transcriptional activator hap5 [Rhodotorula kratochvilovae]